MNIFIGLIIVIIIVYVFGVTTDVKKLVTPPPRVGLLHVIIRLLQVLFFLFVLLLGYDSIHYLFNGSFQIMGSPIFSIDHELMRDGFEVISITFTIMFISLNFIILEIIDRIALNLKTEFKFDLLLIKRVKTIANLFVLRILLQMLLNTIVFGVFTIGFDSIFIYALLVVLINIFIRALTVQQDSDLAI